MSLTDKKKINTVRAAFRRRRPSNGRGREIFILFLSFFFLFFLFQPFTSRQSSLNAFSQLVAFGLVRLLYQNIAVANDVRVGIRYEFSFVYRIFKVI